MKKCVLAVLALSVAACSSDTTSAIAVATRLATDSGAGLSQAERDGYIACGEKALSPLPDTRLAAALKAPDAPAMWAILGSDALDSYVKTCRQFDLKRRST